MAYGRTQTLKADLDALLCSDFLGLNAVYHGFAWQPEQLDAGMSDADREIEFDYVAQSRLRVARTMFLPNFDCEKIEGPYDNHSPRMEGFVKWCRQMQKMGVDIALQAGWHFSRNTYYGHETADPAKDPEIFAQWAVQAFRYLMDDCGLTNIKYLVLFTEPTQYLSGDVPEGYTLWSYYAHTCRTIHEAFKAAGLRDRLKFLGPNNHDPAGVGDLDQALRDLDDVIDIYTCHLYNYVKYGQAEHFCQTATGIVKATGKPFWMDEYGHQHESYRTSAEYGNYLGMFQSAIINSGMQTSTIWILVDQLYPDMGDNWPLGYPESKKGPATVAYNTDSFIGGVHRWGLTTWPRDTMKYAGEPYPAFSAFKLINAGMGGVFGGGKVSTYHVEQAMTVFGAAACQDGEWSFLLVNDNNDDTDIRYEFTKPIQAEMFLHVYDPSHPYTSTQAAPQRVGVVGTEVTVTLPANGVAILSTRERL